MGEGVRKEQGVERVMERGVLRRERVKMVWGVGREEWVRIHDRVWKG